FSRDRPAVPGFPVDPSAGGALKNDDDRSHRNEVGRNTGSAVQAGTVHGGVHNTFHRTTVIAGGDRGTLRSSMPSAPAIFVDREHDLEEIGRLLERTTGTCVLLCEGPRGVGKSALLLRAAAALAGRVPHSPRRRDD